MNKVQLIGLFAGVLTSISAIPQVIKIIKDKKVEDISIGMFLTLVCGIGIWVYYGILRDDWPVIITNAFSLLINLTILILYKKYKK